MFSNSNDFNRILDAKGTISEIFHAAKIEVNEEGAEASGATLALMTFSASRDPQHYLNREFSFFIVDYNTRMILFSGVYRGPEDDECDQNNSDCLLLKSRKEIDGLF